MPEAMQGCVEWLQQAVHADVDADNGCKRRWRPVPGCTGMQSEHGRLQTSGSLPGQVEARDMPG